MAEPTDVDNEESADDPWADAFAESGDEMGEGEMGGDLVEDSDAGSESVDLEMILDIPVTISMEIGRTQISIRNLLKLNQGSVVELDRLAGEPLDVLVNGTLIAHGEVVVVNEKFGIRLTDVITAMERIKKLT
jgi:flagellar motor switch protein FliN/FliY